MTIHLWLLSIAILIPASVWVLTRFWRCARRHPLPFLKPLFFFLLGTVVYFSLNFFPAYMETNLPDAWKSLVSGSAGRTFLGIWVLLSLAITIVSTFFFIRAMAAFRAAKEPYWAEYYLALLAVGFIVFWLLHRIFPANGLFSQAYVFLRSYPLRYLNLLYLVLLLGLRRFARRSADSGRTRLARSFAAYFLIRETFDLLSTLSADFLKADANRLFELVGLSGDVIYLALTVLLTYLWMQRHLLPEQNREMNAAQTGQALAILASRFSLSEREQEIVRLVVSGKGNKEIGVRLSLSASTVKNHIYNIYQKMNINSRFELIDLVRQHEKAE